MFMDVFGYYLTPVRPAFKNPPSRYRSPAYPKRYKYESPHKKYRKPPAPRPRRYTVPGEGPRRDPVQPMPRYPLPPRPRVPLNPVRRAKWAKPLFRVHPVTRALSYAWDAYDAYSGADQMWYQMPGGIEPAPGYLCYSYNAAIDNGTCDEIFIGSFAATNGTVCSTWHYQAQSFFYNSSNKGRAWGPKQGGFFGCQRYNLAHVAVYPDSVPANKRDPIVKPGYIVPLPDDFTSPLPDPAAWPKLGGEPPAPPVVPLYAEPALERQPNGSIRRVVHYRARPEPGVKERKRIVPIGAAASLASKIFHAATEGMDFVDSIFEALPKSRQRGAERPDQKLAAIWKYLDEINWWDAGANLVINQLEDRVIGTLMSQEAGGSVLTRYKAGTPGKMWK